MYTQICTYFVRSHNNDHLFSYSYPLVATAHYYCRKVIEYSDQKHKNQ
jgi:hypothetical protein